MQYISTRGAAPALGFADAMLAGLAMDGGLYMPETWPQLPEEQITRLADKPYVEVAFAVMWPFVKGSISEAEFRKILVAAYDNFSHPAVTPLVQLDYNSWVLELFHGPTLAFKDVAMQTLSRLMDRFLQIRGKRACILGATSGDTGGSAIEAFRGLETVDIFILYPHGAVSEVQRLQMTTPDAKNVHAIALEGTFDDCQHLVKAMFNDHELRNRLNLTGVNSINWARIMAQIVYYFAATANLGANADRKAGFSVPTGNFGDILAGFAAGKMGCPIDRLIIATNINDILYRCVTTGHYEPLGVVHTQSPSMDIQISSNFERLLFELSGRNSTRLVALMNNLQNDGFFELSATELAELQNMFSACRVDEEQTRRTIAEIYAKNGYQADPHTAVGLAAALQALPSHAEGPVITLATAHPAKFPDVVTDATGSRPILQPKYEQKLRSNPERYSILANNYQQVTEFIGNTLS
jgi:threonine synthase